MRVRFPIWTERGGRPGRGRKATRKMRSCSAAASARFWVVALALMAAASSSLATADGDGGDGRGEREAEARERGRSLLGFKETKGNASYRCSPSGPCLPCQYSQKNDEKYHCSETGYLVPYKCTEITNVENEDNKNKIHRRLASILENSTIVVKEQLFDVHNYKWRKLLDASSNQNTRNVSYITYRSCVPVVVEEKLSFLGFEVIIVGLLLISGPIVYFRQKRLVAIPGAGFVRVPINVPRF
ncbi:uncharacterized protein LOC122054564 isoform X1 [Zingiber officinale]|uniref:uncharacterized protein LOC122054564 isoform X1 n=1 Tax=Zingiber officinale TaxID=94328 RepID=UPI001C4AFD15|nr:uncharacterized protein LOC122054564 isoform X1 [Zingiber officinale]